jgi:hypothetical protein
VKGIPHHARLCSFAGETSSRCTVRPILTDYDWLETVLALIKQLEATLLGMKQLRSCIGKGDGSEILEVLIEEAETKLAEIKRRAIQ